MKVKTSNESNSVSALWCHELLYINQLVEPIAWNKVVHESVLFMQFQP